MSRLFSPPASEEPDVGGYSASIWALPGCHTQGETLDEVRANLREAAEGWLAVAHDTAIARDSDRKVT
jgi:predicted RNase H-like HicB family nuclease